VARSRRDDSKVNALRDSGTLNPHPETVLDDLFLRDGFFDPDDLLQVKYEMLRRTRVERLPVSTAARAFGLSRPTFYKSQAAFEGSGLVGLLPGKRGPRGAHKLTEEVMKFVSEQLASDPSVKPEELARRIREGPGVKVHPRSIARALARKRGGSS